MIERVMVVGGGTMGRGIAQSAAAAGLDVLVREVDESFARRAREGIEKSLDRAMEKGKVTAEQRERTLSHLSFTDRLEPGSGSDLVIEAIAEDLRLKQDLFRALERVVRPEAILATNTSSLRVSALASACARPERVIGLHFFNPAPAIPLVEVVRGAGTSAATAAAATAFVQRLGKTPVEVKDAPGFVVNRLLIPLVNDAARLCEEGTADRGAIDTAMTLGAGHPMGPLALADLIGIDIVVDVLESLERETGDPRYRPCGLLRTLVADGALGRKTKRGFFEYGTGPGGAAR